MYAEGGAFIFFGFQNREVNRRMLSTTVADSPVVVLRQS